MTLVDYESSESDQSEDESASQHAAKKRKVENVKDDKPATLPPLPSGFQDLYSSTVRTSTQDDPSLHHGRTRVTPHVEGNWPTHVYLDCKSPDPLTGWPSPKQSALLSAIVDNARPPAAPGSRDPSTAVVSLLENELGVRLPLHVSLSRPLVLQTDRREPFLSALRREVARAAITAFSVEIGDLAWHPNESNTRWFLVVRTGAAVGVDTELDSLLEVCNAVAAEFGQPRLYVNPSTSHASSPELVEASNGVKGKSKASAVPKQFHISLAWSLPSHDSRRLPPILPPQLGNERIEVAFDMLKIRIGQDVHSISLPQKRINVA